jgi:hypothetical protein
MASFAFIFGNLVFDHMWGVRSILKVDKKSYTIFHVASCITLMISGLINMIILVKTNNYIKNLAYAVWKNILIGKFILTLALTPILEKIVPSGAFTQNPNVASDNTKNGNIYFKIRLTVVIMLFLFSPFLRYYRESFLKAEIKNDIPAGGVKVNTD